MLLGEVMSSAQICLLAISLLQLLWLRDALRDTALNTVSRSVNGGLDGDLCQWRPVNGNLSMETSLRSLVLCTGMEYPHFTNKKLKKHRDPHDSSKVTEFLNPIKKITLLEGRKFN